MPGWLLRENHDRSQPTTPIPRVTSNGAIDSDGNFRCGQVDGSPPEVSYSLTTGRIALANGQPASMSGIGETTTVIPGFECDLQVGFEGTFVGLTRIRD